MNILNIKNCSIFYGDFQAVKNVSLSVRQGEILSIVGESGSGKSTLLKAIIGVLSKDNCSLKGEINFGSKNLITLNAKEWETTRSHEIGMIFQSPDASFDPIKKIEPQFTESIRVREPKKSTKACINIAKKMLKLLNLTDVDRVLSAYPFQLSGGMKQRVSIAMAMDAKPQLLLADEPTSALDVTIQAQVVQQIKELKTKFNATVIIVTHNMGVASYISDSIAVMKDGEIVEYATRDEVIYHPKTEYTKELLSAVPSVD